MACLGSHSSVSSMMMLAVLAMICGKEGAGEGERRGRAVLRRDGKRVKEGGGGKGGNYIASQRGVLG